MEMKRNGRRAAAIVAVILCSLTGGYSAYAAAAGTAGSMSELEKKLGEAMQSRPAAYNILYTGGTVTSADLRAVFKNIYDNDNYLHYSIKSYKAKSVGMADRLDFTFTFSYWETAEEAAFVKRRASEILAEIIKPEMGEYGKEKAIHDWIVTNLSYDTSLKQHSAYAGLVAPYKTVCQGYALLSYRLLKDAGLENHIVEGTANGVPHAWNIVKVDGNWYHFDTTWDDPAIGRSDDISYRYFNLTDEQMAADHSWSRERYPEANGVQEKEGSWLSIGAQVKGLKAGAGSGAAAGVGAVADAEGGWASPHWLLTLSR